jgi:serine/threonine-protein kinase
MTATLDRAAFEAQLTTLGFDENVLETRADGTLYQASSADLEALPNILDDLELKKLLGRGGMGTVHLARQQALRRDVAVKRVAPERRGAAHELLTEARVMGALEHPNIVPVHGLGVDDNGDLLFVMKRVSGTLWADRIAGEVDLERELPVLIEVSRAVHYAHEQGFLHRDLKPSNVMIGDFDEVYVLDWGLAIAIGDRDVPGLPHARDATLVTGTPAYMAPEMALPEGGLSRQTDVYLLGACLHELVTGAPPHAADDVVDSLHKAHTASTPELPLLDEELRTILQRALAREPEARFQTARELADALEAYLSHAAARVLLKSAAERLELIPGCADDEAGDLAARRAFDEARFSFEQVLQVWPDAPEVEEDRHRATEQMAERELRRGRAEGAALLLSGLRDPPADLSERIEAARQAELARSERAEALERDQDIRIGAGPRALGLATLGPLWFLTELYVVLAHDSDPPWWPYVGFELASLGVVCFIAIFWRAKILATLVGRQLATMVFVCSVASVAIWGYAAWADLNLGAAHAIAHLILVVACFSGLGIERRLILPGALQLATLVAVLVFPSDAPLISGVLGGVALTSLAWGAMTPSHHREDT